ncbi:uncharacterized protein C11orf16 homolog [Scomber scombrus]|uniref:Uncharacterized protein C11orf16 homolog n=1 Tax=Scomber scombrus TaxID=13677 RepID=A0AAV1N4X1_SCOSC
MTYMQTAASEAALIPLFLGKRGCSITFVLDSSENMRAALEAVKRLLIQTLLTKASLRDSLFNVMTFSGKVNCWSHHMRPCTPDTVYTTLSWIHSISCSPGKDLLAALSMALTDPNCQAVHLLTSDLPNQPEAVLRALPALAAWKPVNVFYLQDSGSQLVSKTRDYLQCLTHATRGSCYMISVNLNGSLEKLTLLYVSEGQSSGPSVSPVKCCRPSTSLIIPQQHNTSSPQLRCSLCNFQRPVTSCVPSGRTLTSSEFLPGGRVLARREMDGFYYLGTVIQQVQGCRGVWVVEFDYSGSVSLAVVSSKQQLVCSLDMLNQTRAHTHCLVPGDTVLSPWEPDLRRYGPGKVMAATERRGSFGADCVTSFRVLMWNGCVSLVPVSLVLPISASHHDRIIRELQMPTSTLSRSCNWLCARSSSSTPRPVCTDCCQSASTSYCSITNLWPCVAPPSCRSSLGRMDGLDKAERDKQVDFKDIDILRSDPEAPSSSSSFLSDDETRATCPPADKLKSKQQRPPWRYWSRTGPEPQHRQPGGKQT